MKNKEIVEMIQNRIEDIYQSGEYLYQAKELEKILSYIEQLEADCEDANESITWWTNRFSAVERDNRNLKNNRDKAIEFLEEKRKVFEWYDTDLFYLESLLKGDSDEI